MLCMYYTLYIFNILYIYIDRYWYISCCHHTEIALKSLIRFELNSIVQLSCRSETEPEKYRAVCMISFSFIFLLFFSPFFSFYFPFLLFFFPFLFFFNLPFIFLFIFLLLLFTFFSFFFPFFLFLFSDAQI